MREGLIFQPQTIVYKLQILLRLNENPGEHAVVDISAKNLQLDLFNAVEIRI